MQGQPLSVFVCVRMNVRAEERDVQYVGVVSKCSGFPSYLNFEQTPETIKQAGISKKGTSAPHIKVQICTFYGTIAVISVIP